MLQTTNKTFFDTNVYEAAKERLKFCFQNYDDVVCNYSGGKDSMVVALLCKEVMDELGITKKLKVVFYDEEFVYPETQQAVEEMFALPWVQNYRICLNTEWTFDSALGVPKKFMTWDKSREFFRPLPKDAILLEKSISMNSAELALKEVLPDKTARVVVLMGIRTEESIVRLSTIISMKKRGKLCFLRKSKVKNITLASPIYDWTTNDIFYYIKNQKILQLNKRYFVEMLLKKALRVGCPFPPIQGNSASNLYKLKLEEPQFYERIIYLFPEYANIVRYSKNLAKNNNFDDVITKYGLSIKGIANFINTIEDWNLRAFSLRALRKFKKDYLDFDRYKKYKFTYEEAIRKCFIEVIKGNVQKSIMLGNKPPSRKKYDKTT